MEPDEEKSAQAETKERSAQLTHDKFVYRLWSNLEFARLFFQNFLPESILNAIDLETLDNSPTRMVGENGREDIGDLFYKVKLKQGSYISFIFQLEHKSTPDRFVAIQMYRYVAHKLAYMADNQKDFVDENGLLPIPVSILLCQHTHPQLDQLLQKIDGIDFRPPSLQFLTVNFQKTDFEKLRDVPLLSSVMRISKYSDKPDKDMFDPELIQAFVELFQSKLADKELFQQHFKTIFNYVAWLMRDTTFSSSQFEEILLERLDGQEREVMQDAAEEFLQAVLNRVLEERVEQKVALVVAQSEARVAQSEARVAQSEARVAQSEARVAQSEARAAQSDQIAKKVIVKSINRCLRIRFEELTTPKELSERIEQTQELAKLEEVESLIDVCESYEEFLRRAYEVLA